MVVGLVAGVALISTGLLSQQHAPQPGAAQQARSSNAVAPPDATARNGVAPSGATAGGAAPADVGTLLSRSLPVSLNVPAIGVHSDLLTLGLNADNTVEVPPLGPVSQAGWYEQSPTPGQAGPAIVLGHIDSARYGPGVFFKLGALVPGDAIEVTRADHTVAVFSVDQVESYPKTGFPSLQIYGNTANSQLRLITCGGVFDRAARSYENNIVAFASLTSTRPA